MKAVYFNVYLETGFAGCTHNETLCVDVEDNATEQEIDSIIEEETKDWIFNKIDYGFEIITAPANRDK